MKKLRISLLALAVIAITVMGSAFKANFAGTDWYQFNTGLTFEEQDDPTNILDDGSNYTEVTPTCSSGDVLCGLKVVITSASEPTEQEVIDKFMAEYEALDNHFPTQPIQVVDGSKTYSIEVLRKS